MTGWFWLAIGATAVAAMLLARVRREEVVSSELTDSEASRSDEYYLAMAALDLYPVVDRLPKSTSVVFRIHQIGHQRDRLRAALVGLVGADTRAELEQLEAAMRLMPAPAEDKAATIDAIHAILATLTEGRIE